MKVGLSYGRCIRDIVEGKVDCDDVLIIVSKTAMRDRDHIENVIRMYSYEPDYLMGLDMDECLRIGYLIWDQGKLYQPRLIADTSPSIMSSFLQLGRTGAVWCDLVPSYMGGNEMVDDAFKNYLMLRRLSE